MAPQSKRNKSHPPPATSSSSAGPHSPPQWPPLSPLLPAADLAVITLHPDQVLTIPHLWTSTLCRTYVNFLATLPLTTTPGKPRRGDAVRVNDRFQVEDTGFAERLWSCTALQELCSRPVIEGRGELDAAATRELWGGEVLGLNSNIRIYRYTRGQFFDQHCKLFPFSRPGQSDPILIPAIDDESNNVAFSSPTSPSPVPAKTTWTLLLYLTAHSTGCEGGQTVFHPAPVTKRGTAPPPVVADLQVGMALLHRHGKDCLLHEGKEVTAGEKWVIRSDLCVRR